jgi:hypothetical protein
MAAWKTSGDYSSPREFVPASAEGNGPGTMTIGSQNDV